MSHAIPFTKAQGRRAVQAAESTGRPVKGFRLNMRDGTIEVEFGELRPIGYGQSGKPLAASWDDA
jgi:hypothetical protein